MTKCVKVLRAKSEAKSMDQSQARFCAQHFDALCHIYYFWYKQQTTLICAAPLLVGSVHKFYNYDMESNQRWPLGRCRMSLPVRATTPKYIPRHPASAPMQRSRTSNHYEAGSNAP